MMIWIDTPENLQKIKEKEPILSEFFIREHTELLFKATLKLGFNKEEAEDIVQSTWITFFEVVNRFEGRSKLKTFLFGILYNKASEFKKRNFRLKESLNIEDILNENFDHKNHWIKGPIHPDQFSISLQIKGIITKCLELLPINQKMAFHLKEIEEEETSEICKMLNVTTSNLGVLLFRARNQLRECVESKSGGGLHDEV
jgi:RNA polymerase sigma-70 factor (ECF subfamily)